MPASGASGPQSGPFDVDVDLALDVALAAVRAGCGVLGLGRARLAGLDITAKAPGDITTEVDRAAEKAILERIRQSFPDHASLGEETLARGAGPYRWVVDPLDGTVNYVHSIPYYGVSVALEAYGQTILGVVADPVRGEFFYAAAGRGAFVNGERMSVSRCPGLGEAVVGTVVPGPSWPHMDAYLERFCAVARRAAGMRRAGAAALDLAYVAAGRLDGFFVLSLKRWDVLAGALLVAEAGGMVANLDGHADPLETERIAAGNPAVLGELAPLVSLAPQGAPARG